MRQAEWCFLEERGKGFPTPAGPVPIVPAAALSGPQHWPRERPSRLARLRGLCMAVDIAEGCVRAYGAMVAKLNGPSAARWGSELGHSCAHASWRGSHRRHSRGQRGCMALNPSTGTAVWPCRPTRGTGVATVRGREHQHRRRATTAPLDSGGVLRLAMQAHDGLSLTIRPCAHAVRRRHAVCVVAADHESLAPNPLLLGAAAVDVVVDAMLRAVRVATRLHGVPAGGWVTLAEQAVGDRVERFPTTWCVQTRPGAGPDRQPAGRCYAECAD